jgi:cyclohexa-1,5-dienecarbonyl-CoA hydratase
VKEIFTTEGTEASEEPSTAVHEGRSSRRLLVRRELGNRLLRIELNHPPLNVIDFEMMDQLVVGLAEAEASSEVSVIVLRGAGKAFSAGVDVAVHTADKVEVMLAKFHAVIRALVSSKKVTVAAVHGSCLGGGAELALVCDMVFTSSTAAWGFPEIKLACFPPVAATALAALVGQKRAAELILTGKTITGAEAAQIGLANRAVAEGELESVVEESVEHLAALSPAALAVTKKAIYAWDSMHFDKGLARAERVYLEDLVKTNDMQEGIAAFMEKRPPRWEDK